MGRPPGTVPSADWRAANDVAGDAPGAGPDEGASPDIGGQPGLHVIALIFCIYLFNQIDRNLVQYVLEPIGREMNLTDGQLGFIAGPALAFCYAIFGVPIAIFADSRNRVHIIAAAIVIWSGFALSTAYCTTFTQLVIARFGVGIGEAGFSAIALSLITDLYKPSRRAAAVGIFSSAIPASGIVCGALVAFVIGVHGWRTGFTVAAVPGFILALLLLKLIRDPRERAVGVARTGSLKAALSLVWSNRAMRHLVIGQGLANIVAAGVSTWAATYFARAYKVTPAETGFWLATMAGLVCFVSIWLGTVACRYAARRGAGWMLFGIIAAVNIFAVPLIALMLFCGDKLIALFLYLAVNACLFFFIPTTNYIGQQLAPAGMRATIAALIVMIQVLVGATFGIQLVGVLSDGLNPLTGNDTDSLRIAMMILSICSLWSAAHYFLAMRATRTSKDNAADA